MQEQQMKNRDKRTRLMSELLSNIKRFVRWQSFFAACQVLIIWAIFSIKLYAWEYSFLRKILDVRNNQELKMLKRIGIVTVRFVGHSD